MKRKSIYIICILLSISCISCVSNKNFNTTMTKEEISNYLLIVNSNCAPYKEKYIEFSIMTNEIQKSNYEDKNIFKVIIDHGILKIGVYDKYKNLGSTEEEQEFIRKSVSEINMLLKYLSGFYFGEILTGELEISTKPNNNLIFYNEYNYNNTDCINYFNIENNLLTEFQTYIKNNLQMQVDTKYKYTSYKNKNYLQSFESNNYFHSLYFALDVSYQEKEEFLIPEQFTLTTKQYVNNDGEIGLLTTKFIILIDRQLIK